MSGRLKDVFERHSHNALEQHGDYTCTVVGMMTFDQFEKAVREILPKYSEMCEYCQVNNIRSKEALRGFNEAKNFIHDHIFQPDKPETT